MPTDLYRHYDAKGQLLYVGISYGTVARLQQHKEGRKGWVADIARIEVEKFRTRGAAERAEAKAIIREKPLYNKRIPTPPKVKRRQRPAHDHPTRMEFVVGRAHQSFNALSLEDQERAANGEMS